MRASPAASTTPPFPWITGSKKLIGVAVVVLIAAALQAGTARRQVAVLAVAAGALPLAEASVMIFACAALALVGVGRLLRLHGRARIVGATREHEPFESWRRP